MTEFLEALQLVLAQPAILAIYATLLGLIFGGFATVAGDRLGQLALAEDEGREPDQEMGLWWPASRCEQCGRSLTVMERMPGIGWFVVAGKCKSCGYKVPISAPLTEWACAVLFALIAIRGGASWATLFYMFAAWSFITLSLSDLKHRTLPDSLTYPLLWGGLIAAAFGLLPISASFSILGAVAGFSFLWVLQEIYWRWRGIMGIGGGDVKLMAAIGAWVGIEFVFMTAALAAVIGLVVFGLLAALRLFQDEHKPFGPMLALAGLWATLRPEDIKASLDWLALMVAQ
jgi:Type II secretory pathway, prepilin signal peptidase PulO and related peptidases